MQLVLRPLLDPWHESALHRGHRGLEQAARRRGRDDGGDRGQRGHHPLRGGPLREQLREDVGGGQQAERGGRTGGELHDPGEQREPG